MKDFPRANVGRNKASTNSDGPVARDEIDDGVDAGAVHAANLLDLKRATDGPMIAMGFAGGMAASIRAWMSAHHGLEATYELYQRLADDTASQIIGKRSCQ